MGRTVILASPMLSWMSPGKARAYCRPCAESGESPPILPCTL